MSPMTDLAYDPPMTPMTMTDDAGDDLEAALRLTVGAGGGGRLAVGGEGRGRGDGEQITRAHGARAADEGFVREAGREELSCHAARRTQRGRFNNLQPERGSIHGAHIQCVPRVQSTNPRWCHLAIVRQQMLSPPRKRDAPPQSHLAATTPLASSLLPVHRLGSQLEVAV